MPPKHEKGGRLAALKARLEAVGASPLRRYGQNFLLDINQVTAILRDAELTPLDTVLEVGPGSGFLSEGIARTGAGLLCVEIDTRVAMLARETLSPYQNASLLEGDILDGKHGLNAEAIARIRALWTAREKRGLKCISNLPYAIATSFMVNLCMTDLPWARGVYMVQKEVAERAVAKSGHPDFGSLSVAMHVAAERVTLVRPIPPEVFWPRPKVQSAILMVDYKPVDVRCAVPWKALRLVTNAIFSNRRKNLRNSFKMLFPKGDRDGHDRLCERLGMDPESKAIELSPDEMLRAAQLVASDPHSLLPLMGHADIDDENMDTDGVADGATEEAGDSDE